MLNVISLGAGVQSSTMLLMADRGLIQPMPDAAVFADTQDEPASVYRWLEVIKTLTKNIPIHTVTNGSLSDASLKMRVTKDGRKFCTTNIPFHTLNADGSVGKIQFRSCTADYKIKPIIKWLRKFSKKPRRDHSLRVTSWIGISMDEMRRMKPSRESWIMHRWPLVEMRMDRKACLRWMEDHKLPTPPRSSCVYCPFHSDLEWRRLKAEEPESFQKAVEFEKAVQAAKHNSDNFDSVPFLHKKCIPLDQIDFRSDVEKGQMVLWDDECEGMCGV